MLLNNTGFVVPATDIFLLVFKQVTCIIPICCLFCITYILVGCIRCLCFKVLHL